MPRPQPTANRPRVVATIPKHTVRPLPRSPALGVQRGNRIHQRQGFLRVVPVRAGQTNLPLAATTTWSRALLKALVEELYPDDLFAELVGNLDRVASRQWPHVIASRASPNGCASP
jgi:hypothetical protein